MTGLTRSEPGATEAEVTRFLRANPSFLADNPSLYAHLTPPQRVHGDGLADHMAAMLRAARAGAASSAGQAREVVEAARAASGLAGRVQEAVLALLHALVHAADLGDCIGLEWPALLGLDAVTLCVEAAAPACRGARCLPSGTVLRLLGARDVVFRREPQEALAALHGEAARLACHDALVRVPLARAPALLALASRDAQALHGGQGVAAPAFLGRAVAAALER
jgi:uncharacterized protein YigA (DUF484 family)